MTATLVKFGFVMLVVMVGFAMALHVLLRDIDFSETFGETLLVLFKAMLGDTDLFDEFSGERYDSVATVLVVVYLLIMTIMLLNLLVAILSTAHAQVQGNVEGEFRVSKARIIEYYRLVVEKDLLPAPFNLIQPITSIAKAPFTYCSKCWRHQSSLMPDRPSERNSRAPCGEIIFSFVLGSVAVVVGAMLWVGSALPIFPYSQYAWYARYIEEKEKKNKSLLVSSVLGRYALISVWCFLGAPLSLISLWLQAFARVTYQCFSKMFVKDHEEDFDSARRTRNGHCNTVDRLLRMGPGGVGIDDLLKFLEDPMDDEDIRQDERDRRATVEHIKLLRNRLERSRKRELSQLDDDVKALRDDMTTTILGGKRLEEALRQLKVDMNLEEELRKLNADMQSNMNELRDYITSAMFNGGQRERKEVENEVAKMTKAKSS